MEGHLRRVAEKARGFAERFEAGGFAYAIGLWHDLGKINPEFQDYLRAAVAHRQGAKRTPHAIFGAAFVRERLHHVNADLGTRDGAADRWPPRGIGGSKLWADLRKKIQLAESKKDSLSVYEPVREGPKLKSLVMGGEFSTGDMGITAPAVTVLECGAYASVFGSVWLPWCRELNPHGQNWTIKPDRLVFLRKSMSPTKVLAFSKGSDSPCAMRAGVVV